MMDALGPNFSGAAVTADESYLPARNATSRADDATLSQEFEQRLANCPKLAYRVALGVLRNTAEAEDVAQEAMLRAYRNFHRLRDRDRFRAWLVRTAWRLALDRIRSAGRRERREMAVGEGYDTREVAKLVGVPEGTVKSRLHLARKRLAASLRNAGVSPAILPPKERT